MKLIIEHLKVKRQIEGTGFNICGSEEDLRKVARSILSVIDDQGPFSYGWISIRDQNDEHSSGVNLAPIGWKE